MSLQPLIYKEIKERKKEMKSLQGSGLTFQLASPVASDRFDPLAKINFSLARRTFFSFKIPIHDFHVQNNLFHLNSIRCKDRHWCYNYIGSTMITVVFASGRNCPTTSQLAAKKHFFFIKMRIHDFSWTQQFIPLQLISKLQTQASILYRHHSNFRTSSISVSYTHLTLPTKLEV